ncbi:hypothetical protein BRC83_05380 [Halobacteriales archaeon QS_1_68_17]|nr:MAG: hypothetical protein BRC83_05380 [Halobacteriales archaeon QS_1_68_17]
MATIGAWWVSSHDALPDEEVQWSGKGMWVKPTGSMIGGMLYLTDRRLLFSPHLVERLFRAEKRAVDLDAVESVSAESLSGSDVDSPRGNRLERMIRVEYGDPTEEPDRFAAVDPDAVLERLRSRIG